MEVNSDTKYTDLLAKAKELGIKGIRKKDLLIVAINTLINSSASKELASNSASKEIASNSASKELASSGDISPLEALANKYKIKHDITLDKSFPEGIPHVKKADRYYSDICFIVKVYSNQLGHYSICGNPDSDVNDVIDLYNSHYNLGLNITWPTEGFTKNIPVKYFSILSDDLLKEKLFFIGEDLFVAVNILEKIIKGEKPLIPIDNVGCILSAFLYQTVIENWKLNSNPKIKLIKDTALMFYNKIEVSKHFFTDIYNKYGNEYLSNISNCYISFTMPLSLGWKKSNFIYNNIEFNTYTERKTGLKNIYNLYKEGKGSYLTSIRNYYQEDYNSNITHINLHLGRLLTEKTIIYPWYVHYY